MELHRATFKSFFLENCLEGFNKEYLSLFQATFFNRRSASCAQTAFVKLAFSGVRHTGPSFSEVGCITI